MTYASRRHSGPASNHDLVTNLPTDLLGLGPIQGIGGSVPPPISAIQQATHALDIGPPVVRRHAGKVLPKDAGRRLTILNCKKVLGPLPGAPVLDRAGGNAVALRPCLPGCRTPQSGPKHRLGEMSTGFYNFGVPELAYKFRDS